MKKKQLFVYLMSLLFVMAQAQPAKENNFLTAPTASNSLKVIAIREKAAVSINKVQVSKTINVSTAGMLSNLLTSLEKSTITNLIITGNLDARDFKLMRDSLPLLEVLDVTVVNIQAYSGTGGPYTNQSYNYPANEIPAYAFCKMDVAKPNTTLKSIVFPVTATSIGVYTFALCTGFTSINLPATINTIKDMAFVGFYGSFTVDSNNPNYAELNGILMTKNQQSIIQCPVLKSGSYVISSGVKSIGDYAFYGCNLLSSLTIPASVTSIGSYAFFNCLGLTSMTVNTRPEKITIGGSCFYYVNTSTCVLNVPFGTKILFQYANQWSNFTNIAENEHGFSVNMSSMMLPSKSSTGNVIITTNDAWTVTSEQIWISLNKTSGTGSDTIQFRASENPTTDNRIATLTFSVNGFDSQTVTITQSGLPKTVNTTAGGLSTSMTASELSSVINLKITGTIDARDFKTMRDNMPKLAFLDLSEATVAAYSGPLGTASWITVYAANRIPEYAFNVGMSSQQFTLAAVSLPATINAIGDYAFYSCEALTDIVIPNSVTYIGPGGFGSCNSLINVILPNNLTSIENSAFMGCPISTITIPNTVKTIGQYGFGFCKKLQSINIPNSVTTVINSAFESCTALTNLTIGNSVTYIGNSAFSGCSSLTAVVLPNSVTTLDGFAFANCTNLKSASLPNSLATIGYYCFSQCGKLTDILIPNSVTKIDYSAFSYCNSLSSITIPNSVTTLGYSAFSYCSALTTLSIPNSVTSIGNNAFDGCTGLTSINVNRDVPLNLSASTSVFNNVNKISCILNVPFGTKNRYAAANQWQDFSNITENIHGISLGTDSVKLLSTEGSKGSVSIKSNDSWTTLSNQTWLRVSPDTGTGNDTLKLTADANASSLKRTATVTVTSGNVSKTITVIQAASPKIVNITAGGLATALTPAELTTITNLTISGTINARDFKIMRDSMPTLETIDLSSVAIVAYTGSLGTAGNYNYTYPVNEIPQSAFFNSNTYTGKTILKTILLPVLATSIGSSAFQRCSGITDIKIPSTVKYITSNTFQSCSGLTSIIMPISVKSISNYAFQYCSGLTDLVIPDSVSSLGSSSFEGCRKLKNVTLSKSLTSISYSCFKDCISLTNIVFPNSVKTIKEYAFSGAGLTSLVLPEAVTSIDYNSFAGCKGLTEIALPNSLTSIGTYAFSNCTGLKKITLGNTVSTIKSGTFYSCTGLTDIVIPESVISIESSAFYNCSSLTNITIPESVTSIGSETFRSCTSLTTISIPESVNQIDWSAFYSCTGLTSIYAYPLIPVDLSSVGMSSNVFYNVDTTNCVLYVPYQTKALYATAIQWKDFDNIVENPFNLVLESRNAKLLATEGSNTSIKVFSNSHWTATSDKVWLSVNPPSGSGNNSITLTAHANPSILTRIATVTVSVPGVLPKTITVIQAASPKIVNNTAGSLSLSLATDEIKTVSNLVVTGTIDARDFKFMRDGMPLLSTLDISNVSIIAYKGTEGTYGTYNYTYPANEIPQNSFYYNNTGKVSLTSVILPSTTTSLGSAAFTLCAGLDSIVIPNLVTGLTSNVFSYCKGLKKVTIGNSVKKIDYAAFQNCISLTDLVIPNSVTTIGFQAFSGCTGLTNVSIPNSVTSLGYESFAGCTGLVNITIPNSVITIDYHSFNSCTNLKKVTIPNSVTTIGGSAFGNCTSLTDVSLGNSVSLVDFEAFYNCTNLTGINIPNSVITIKNTAFKFCKSLKNITIGNSVTAIGSEAFRECTGLTTVSIPASVKEIDWYAFYSCTNLKSIYAYGSNPVDLSNYGSELIFYNVNKTTCTLYVPTGSKTLYQATAQWKDFNNIIEMTTDVHSLDNPNINIYPNPVKESFRIIGLNEKAVLSLIDLNGKMIFSKPISDNEAISAKELPQGTYTARITTSTGTLERKLIKK